MTSETTYPNFEYAAEELSAYAQTLDVFVISLKNKSVMVFNPSDPEAFRKWLCKHGVRNIRQPATN